MFTASCHNSSVFGHLLPYVEQDNIYKLIVNTNGGTVLPPSINNARRADDSSATATFQRSVIPSFQAPSDPTAGASTGVAADGSLKGDTSFADQIVICSTAARGLPRSPRLHGRYDCPVASAAVARHLTPGTSNVVMYATRYATCNSVDSYWASVNTARAYFNNTYPQTQPNVSTRVPAVSSRLATPLLARGSTPRARRCAWAITASAAFLQVCPRQPGRTSSILGL